MKLATCLIEQQQVLALIEADWRKPLNGRALPLNRQKAWPESLQTMQALLENSQALDLVRDIEAEAKKSQWISVDQLQLLAPIPIPRRNIICLGWNYAEHAAESSAAKDIQIEALPDNPIVFTKATTTVNSPFGDIIDDTTVSGRLDWEVELGVIIGRGGRHIDKDSALDHVFGYTVVNDVSARDLQKRHQQFFMGKSVDGTCPIGPWIVTADEIPDPQNLSLKCEVNGKLKQDGNTSQQIFDVVTVISILSKVMTLLPGDIIATGTPSGVGFARNPPEYLRVGDVVQCQVESVGLIRNSLVSPVRA